MDSPDIIHLGGKNTVTGSCHLLKVEGVNILIDCGLVQGDDSVLPMESWPVKPSDADYLFLTHAHIDHIGRVPELIQKGFKGEIITTHPTKAMLSPVLEDAMGLTAMPGDDIQRLSKTIDELSWGFEYNQEFRLKKSISFKLGCAGHILGSCFIRFEIKKLAKSVIFSGDIGAKNTPILPDPDIPDACDILVLESTYGDRLHEDRLNRVHRLGKILTQALSDEGKVYIPAFAMGRTQELVYEMDRLFSDPELRKEFPDLNPESKIPVFIDSPLGLKITRVYSVLSDYWDDEAVKLHESGDHPIDFDRLYAVNSHNEHIKLTDINGPAVIIAGSGMCTGGRIINHLKNGIQDPENDIFFVGYQARGTLGRAILRYSRSPGGYVYLQGKKYNIKAKVYSLTGYSAHADQHELIEWVKSMPEKPGQIRLVHGESKARKILADRLEELEYDVIA
ncbi:MAG: MBL fold metallo-hydrolase [Desulfobacterales bacterium]|nr:MBL fold metallo-hydrolase [Desulfobacterales bacterium]